jgi:beta-phosphoglucomutase-like phosphatase (HAD superfamily)
MRALIFDLDGTLVDTVYAHVFAWQRAFGEAGMEIDGWRIHRRIGMSVGLFTRAVARELGRAHPRGDRDPPEAPRGSVPRVPPQAAPTAIIEIASSVVTKRSFG